MNQVYLYNVYWISGTSLLIRKGNRNNLIPRYIQCEGKNIKIVTIDDSDFEDYILRSLDIQLDFAFKTVPVHFSIIATNI